MTTATRQRLPNRREQLTETIEVRGKVYDTSVGFDPTTGQPKELFFAGAKEGSEMAAVLSDGAVLVSVALQWGVPPSELARSLAREPAPSGLGDGRATSPIGAAVDLLVAFESEAPSPSGYDEHADALGSFHDAITAVGDRVRAGEALPAAGYFSAVEAAAE